MQVSLRSVEDEELQVTLSIPTDEVCPITFEPMSTYNLEFAPAFTFVETDPKVRKMTLPCTHSFSAMACLFHFCKTAMRCPLCRKGYDTVLHADSIPQHIRQPFSKIVYEKSLEDRIEQDREDLQSTLQLLQEDVQTNFPHFMSQHTVVMVTYCYETEDPLCPLTSFEFELKGELTENNESIQFSLPRWATRQWSSNMAQCDPIAMVQFAMGLRNQENDFYFLDR